MDSLTRWSFLNNNFEANELIYNANYYLFWTLSLSLSLSLQIRRYVYHDVIRLQDIQKLIDCSLVQVRLID